MRTLFTGLVLAGLVGVGLAAAVDALRAGETTAVHSAVPPAAGDDEAATALEAAGVTGVLTFSDEECRLQAVRLPSLAPAPAPGFEMCEPVVGSRGMTTWKGAVVWSGLGFGTVQVVLAQDEIGRALRGELGARGYLGGGPFSARQVASLGDDRLAVLVEDEAEGWTHLALLDGKRLGFLLALGDVGSEDVVRPSPRGSYFALLDPGAAGVRVFDRDGGPVQIPEVTNPRAIAWSPDERWTALATAWGVHVYPTDDPEGLVVRIPLRVRDLAWDFEPAAPGKG
jgi:hypothetical protein